MLKVFIISLALLFVFETITSTNVKLSNKSLTVNFKGLNDSTVRMDLVDFIEASKKTMNIMAAGVKDKAIMVLGVSGTGKSTLVNYLNDIPLVCKQLTDGKWVVEVHTSSNNTKHASIGHKTSSETLLPFGYTPLNKNFSYIDNPGFQDNRGLAIEIANAFFREQITKGINEFKFLILLTHQDLDNRGDQFRQSIKHFSNFLGVFDDVSNTEILNLLSKSIGIIVSRVDNNGKMDVDMVEYFKNKLSNILMEEKEADNLSENEELVFDQVLSNNQVEIFSNPKKEMLLNDQQKNQILALIDRLVYFKNEAKFRLRISNTGVPNLIAYIEDRYLNFEQYLEVLLRNNIFNYFTNALNNTRVNAPNEFKQIEILINNTRLYGTTKIDFEEFLKGFRSELLSQSEKNHLLTVKETLEYFIQLLPKANKKRLFNKKEWLSSTLTALLNKFDSQRVSKLMGLIESKNEELELRFRILIKDSILKYFKLKIDNATSLSDFKNIENVLKELRANGRQELDFSAFVNSISLDLLNECDKLKLISANNEVKQFVELLENRLSGDKSWLDGMLVSLLDDLIDEIKHYYQEVKCDYDTSGVLTCKGFVIQISLILAKINNDANIDNLKSVRIFTTHLIIIDDNYKIDKRKYKEDSPDLLIVSPRVILNKTVTIDLSCYIIPQVQDGNIKANDGNDDSFDGESGKPGLPGFNGGNLVIKAGNITDLNKLRFLSYGGKGGPGQNGGDGLDGSKGKSPLFSEIPETVEYYSHWVETGVWRKTVWRWQHFGSGIKYYRKKGEPGSNGGDAGRGGCGGDGGYGGKLIIIEDGKIKYEILFEHLKLKGENGRSGIPGLGGRYGDTAEAGKEWKQVHCEKLNSKEQSKCGDFCCIEINGWINQRYIQSKMVSEDGLVNIGCNSFGWSSSTNSKVISINELRDDYSNFVQNITLNFKNSHLAEREILKDLTGIDN